MEKILSGAAIKFYTRAMNFYVSCILHLTYYISDTRQISASSVRRQAVIFSSLKMLCFQSRTKQKFRGESEFIKNV
ncbi:MAG: hypothetical protein Q4C96_05615 [Planctomycetia bacterium]|nr:hypothetical protein [Planctomycetia bacterium]